MDVEQRPETALAAGTVIGERYQIVRAIARGGMGAVYEARDERLSNRRCVLKVLLDAGLSPAERAEAATWFAREATLLSSLRHPLIPTIGDSFSEQGRHYLVMDFIEGESLEDLLARQGAPGLPLEQVRDWGRQLCAVLSYLHTRQPPVIFRDLKPANIMRQHDGTLKLIDFGIARVLEPKRTGQTVHTMIGTPGYSPPEQYQGLADARSDLYSLGATLHHLLSGRDPRLYQPFVFPPLAQSLPDIDPAIAAAIARAVSLLSHDRFATAQEFATALTTRTGRGAAATASPSAPIRRARAKPRLKPRRTSARALPSIPLLPPINPISWGQSNIGRDIYVTSYKLDWPAVCACCCGVAETHVALKDAGEATRGATGRRKRSWDVPLCSPCARHADVYERGRQMPGWSILALALLLLGSASIADGFPAFILGVTASVVIVLRRTRAKQRAHALAHTACCGLNYPVTYHYDDPLREFYFRNDAYAEMFAQTNHKLLCAERPRYK